jgi:prepilin-type processing-associated H-X9-DG protein
MWNPTGGSVVFLDGHARFVTAAGQFDEHRINRSGNKSGEAHPTFGTWYWECD